MPREKHTQKKLGAVYNPIRLQNPVIIEGMLVVDEELLWYKKAFVRTNHLFDTFYFDSIVHLELKKWINFPLTSGQP